MELLTPLNIFGAITVTAMMLAYVGEDRNRLFTFAFGVSSVGASVYGWLSGTWPFGVIEAVWAAFAFRKWFHRGSSDAKQEPGSEI